MRYLRTMMLPAVTALLALVVVIGPSGCSGQKGPAVVKEILQPGPGAVAEAGNYVSTHYTLELSDGTFIESTRAERGGEGTPFQVVIGVGNVIQGWDESVLGMRVGEVSRLTIPPQLAYGDETHPGSPIPGGATLVFEVELLDVQTGPHFEMEYGLTSEIITSGEGQMVRSGDRITAHYTLWLEDGTVVDTSREELGGHGSLSVDIGMGNVIPGWDITIPGMRVGEVRRITVPPVLAYGEQGASDGVIPPDATLLFEVEILNTLTPAGR